MTGLAVIILILISCSSPKNSTAADDRVDSYAENFPGAPVPRSDVMDPLLVDLLPHNPADDSTATLALYSDPGRSPGMARLCVTSSLDDRCEPPLDQDRELVTRTSSHSLFLFSGPDGVGFESDLAQQVHSVAWRVEQPDG